LNSFLITNLSLFFFWFSGWSLASSLLPLITTESRTEVTSCGPNIDRRLHGFHYCVSRMRCLRNPYIRFQTTVSFLSVYSLLLGDDRFSAICCNRRGNGNVAEQRMSLLCFSKRTIPAFRRHVTILNMQCGKSTRGDPSAWRLVMRLTSPHRKWRQDILQRSNSFVNSKCTKYTLTLANILIISQNLE
jgi:hypothetical protein